MSILVTGEAGISSQYSTPDSNFVATSEFELQLSGTLLIVNVTNVFEEQSLPVLRPEHTYGDRVYTVWCMCIEYS